MDYNTQRGELMIKEYGRHIQNLIEKTKKIKDKKERSETAAVIVSLMEMLRPSMRNGDENKHKLWDHFYIIANGDIDIDSPFEKPKPNEKLRLKTIVYPKKEIKYKHYGFNVETLVKKAMDQKDPEKLEAFLNIIGSYMKLLSRNRNTDINDERIKGDLILLSDGKFTFEKDPDFDLLTRTVRQTSNRPRRKDNYKKSNHKRRSRRQGPNR